MADPRRQPSESVAVSKLLSYLLRHGAEKEGLSIRDDGWAKVSDILHLRQAVKLSLTLKQILAVVEPDNKHRYSITQEEGEYLIRANQGHSMQNVSKVEMTPILNSRDLPSEGVAIHGTTMEAWRTIKAAGLSRMDRNRIHFAAGEKGSREVVSGMRNTSQVMIHLDVEKALSDGIPLFLSANNVILSPGKGDTGIIGPEYFKHVLSKDGKAFDRDYPNVPEHLQRVGPVGGTLAQQQKPKST